MGMSASQARLLSITGRLTHNEFRSQMITNSKLRLASQSQEASQRYMDALNSQQLMFATFSDDGAKSYESLTANTILSYGDLKNQYSLVNSAGQILLNGKDIENFEKAENMTEFMKMYGINSKLVDNPEYRENLEMIIGSDLPDNVLDNLYSHNAGGITDYLNKCLNNSKTRGIADLTSLYNNVMAANLTPDIGTDVLGNNVCFGVTGMNTITALVDTSRSIDTTNGAIGGMIGALDNYLTTAPAIPEMPKRPEIPEVVWSSDTHTLEENKELLNSLINADGISDQSFYNTLTNYLNNTISGANGASSDSNTPIISGISESIYGVSYDLIRDILADFDFAHLNGGTIYPNTDFNNDSFQYMTSKLLLMENILSDFVWGRGSSFVNLNAEQPTISNENITIKRNINGQDYRNIETYDSSGYIYLLDADKDAEAYYTSILSNDPVKYNNTSCFDSEFTKKFNEALNKYDSLGCVQDFKNRLKNLYMNLIQIIYLGYQNNSHKPASSQNIPNSNILLPDDDKNSSFMINTNSNGATVQYVVNTNTGESEHQIVEENSTVNLTSVQQKKVDLPSRVEIIINDDNVYDRQYFAKSNKLYSGSVLYDKTIEIFKEFYDLFNYPPSYIDTEVENYKKTLPDENFPIWDQYNKYGEAFNIQDQMIEELKAKIKEQEEQYAGYYGYTDDNGNHVDGEIDKYAKEVAKYIEDFEEYKANIKAWYEGFVKIDENGIKYNTDGNIEYSKRIKDIEQAINNLNDISIQNEVPDETDAKYQWYKNLWYRMGANSETDKGNASYKVIDENLINNKEWLKFALEHGIITLEQAVFKENGSETYPKMGQYDWMATAYTNSTDIVSKDDETAVAIAEARYQKEVREIENKDKKLDQDLKKLDSEHSALQAEYESIKEIVSKNTERSFKAFS